MPKRRGARSASGRPPGIKKVKSSRPKGNQVKIPRY